MSTPPHRRPCPSTLLRLALLLPALTLPTLSLQAQSLQAQSLQAQSPAHLQGTIVDPQGAVIPGAAILLSAAPDGGPQEPIPTPRRVTSDPAGRFSLDAPAGLYTVTISRPGFASTQQQLRLAPASSLNLTLVLSPAGRSETVDITAEGYKAELATSASRLPMSVMDTPQQVQVLTSELLRSRSTESMKQALELIPAVGIQLGEGRRDNFFIRGFNAVSDMYIDGVRDTAQYYRDLSNTDHIEVLEGPAAVLYGRGSSGGLINRVTKKPRLEGTLGELSYTAGSYGEQRGAADLDTIVPGTDSKLGFRLTGAAEHEGSHRHLFWADRYTAAPTLAWRPSPQTSLSLQGELLRDDRLPDRGIPFLPSTGLPAPVPVGTFYGYVGPGPGGNFIHSAVRDTTLDAKHTFASGWNLHAVARAAAYATNFNNMYATSVTARPGGTFAVARGQYSGAQPTHLAFSNLEAYTTHRLLHLTHTALLGVEYGRETTAATQYAGPTNQTPVDLFHPAELAPILSSTFSRNNRFWGQTAALYAQDLVTLSPRWQALIGLRVDDFRQSLQLRPPTNTTPNLRRSDFAASPRLGLVFHAAPWSSLYGNYSRTFDPSGENLTLATNTAQLKPEVTQNYEAGAKFQLLRQRLFTSVSLFRLDRTNIKTTDPANPLALLNLGHQRTQGAEFSFQGNLARRWMVYGGYAWLDGRILSSTTSSNGVSLQGRRPAINPLHSGSLWSSYELTNGLGLSAGLVGKAAQFAATDNLATLPAFTRVDASVFFRRPRYDLQFNLENLANLRYFDTAQSDFQILPAAPINGRATLRYRF